MPVIKFAKNHASALWKVSAFAVFVVCCALNFSGMMYGDQSATFNAAVTLIYVAFWVAYHVFNAKRKSSLTLSIVFSAVLLLSALLGTVTMWTGFAFGGLVFIAIPAITPLYGIAAVTMNFAATYIAMDVLAAGWLFAGILLRRRHVPDIYSLIN
ncbi:MAG: hypothetical protein LBN00_03105 [Oscillospiraceae bacterium]|jgi:hypothetical protein|nr:hypothetical protein [Oscillospiraceae bacterium]